MCVFFAVKDRRCRVSSCGRGAVRAAARLAWVGLLFGWASGCASSQAAQPASSPSPAAAAATDAPLADGQARVVISLQDINCQSCGRASLAALKQRPGVIDAAFDRDKAELTVIYAPEVTAPDEMRAVIEELGYGARIGPGQGRYLEDIAFEPTMDMQVISKAGEDVDVQAHLVPGKFTVIDFYATWCGPCREVDRAMYEALKTRDDVALRKVNVVSWDSPVSKRYMKDVPQLPYVLVFGPDGARIDAISGLDLERLSAALSPVST